MIKDPKKYSILFIEDNPGDFAIVEDLLQEQIIAPVITPAISFKDAFSILKNGTQFNVILLDLTLPDKSGEELITEMLQIASQCPIIILTGYSDLDFSIKSISRGIVDYLLKDDLDAPVLYKSIVYAIERKKATLELQESEKRYSDLFHLSPQPMCLYDYSSFMFTDINKAALEHYGYTRSELLAMTLFEIVPEEDRLKAAEYIKAQQRNINETYSGKFKNQKKSGEVIEVETFSTPLLIDGRLLTLVIAIDVTEKNLYEHKITKAIIKTQEDERYEIGGELHDNVCQILATSLMSLALLKKSVPKPSEVLLDQCKEYISLAAEEIRNLSHRLAPAFFKDSTLQEAFEILLNSFNMEKKYSIALNFDSSMQKIQISIELQLNLYRIMQEQLKNILKYAKATCIEVDVLIYHKRLKMMVTDNGIGFDTDAVRRGIGIANMKRRAELFSGNFDIESSPGKGCSIIIDIPLEA